MTALVLLHAGLDVTLDLELGASGEIRQRGGRRLVVVSHADRCALEWALTATDRVIALTVGPPTSPDPLIQAVARGAIRGVRIWDSALADADLAATSRVLAAAVRSLAPDLVFAGARGLEGATGMLPALVAARLGWPCLEGALQLTRESGGVLVERRLEGGRREELGAECPAVVTVTDHSAEPRYVSVRARRRAGSRSLEAWDLARLGLVRDTVRAWTRLRVDGVDWPRPRPKRTTPVPAVRSAADRLRQLLGGGRAVPATPSPSDTTARVIEGEPGQLADRILAFLASRAFV